MAKLKGKAKKAFLRRMAAGRKKAARLAKNAKSAAKRRRKPSVKRTKSATVKKRRKSSNSMAKRKSKSRSKSRFGIPSVVKKAAAGVGLATIAGVVVSQVAPQAAPVVRPIAAFAGGGIVGTIADLLLSGGNVLGDLFGGGSSGQGNGGQL